MEQLNLHLYPSAFKFESRILKETETIIRLGLAARVIILSAGEKGQKKDENVSPKVIVHRIIPAFPNAGSGLNKVLFYSEFYFRALVFGLLQKPGVINCHSLMMLPLSVCLKKLKKGKLIYDPHELETERLGLAGRSQKVSKWIEKKLIRTCDAVIVVSESIQKWYVEKYKLDNVFLMRNVPKYFDAPGTSILREKLGIPEDKMIFIYQGLINEGRSIQIYLTAFSKLERHQLVVMGYGPMEYLVKEYAGRFSNIHFLSAVKPSEVLAYTKSANVGLSLIENCCLSYYYSLPNKFFEYLMAEIPMIVSNFPDMSSIVNTFSIGWSSEVTEQALVDVVNAISGDDLLRRTQKLKEIKSEFCWEKEETVLATVFEKLRKESLGDNGA